MHRYRNSGGSEFTSDDSTPRIAPAEVPTETGADLREDRMPEDNLPPPPALAQSWQSQDQNGLCDGSEVAPRQGSAQTNSPARPRIILSDRHVADISSDSWKALLAQDQDVFVRSGRLVRPSRSSTGGFGRSVQGVGDDALRVMLHRSAEFVTETKSKDGSRFTHALAIPRDLLSYMREDRDARVRELRRVVSHPVVVDGRIVHRPGYDQASGIIVANTPDIELPDSVSSQDAHRAASTILNDIFGDFPLESDATKAHVLALLLSPLLRQMTGLVPLFAVDAPVAGTGKSLLIRAATTLIQGMASTVPHGPTDELRKRIEALLIEDSPVISIDNWNGTVYGSFLASMLTEEWITIRGLGTHKNHKVRNDALWVVSGNHVHLDREVGRRGIIIRLVPQTDRPQDRKDIRRPGVKLIEHVRNHRQQLLTQLLTMAQLWVQEGCPDADYSMGSFEGWAGKIGAILDLAGVPGFLSNKVAEEREMDETGQQWSCLVNVWWDRHRDRSVTARDLAELCSRHDLFADIIDPCSSDKGRTTSIGMMLKNQRNAVHGGFQIIRGRDPKPGHALYQLRRIGTDPATDPRRNAVAEST